jgi:monomeric sarcosine oxidase
VVVGAGVFGAWTAYHLRGAGYRVILLDQYGPANSRASSSGESRVIRAAYGSDEIYTRMARRSMAIWSAFFARTGHPLFHRTGVLWMARAADTYLQASRETMRRLGIPYRDLPAAELRRLYPQIRVDEDTEALFEPDAGALMARQAVQAVVEAFLEDGGVYRHAAVHAPRGEGRLERVVTSDRESIHADGYVFACGPWLGKLFPDALADRIFITRQEVLFFGIPPGDRRFEPPQMPVWLDFSYDFSHNSSNDLGMYGFPDLENRGFKVAFDAHGPAFDPDTGNRAVSAEKISAAREYLRQRFPVLADAPVVDGRVCQYENTANGDFVIDRHPGYENVWIAGGGSGHGFKHGPAVGEYGAGLVTGSDMPVEARFSFASKGTDHKREVR